ncbi:pyridoxamine 5'-phosphate oxidase family protein [Campylobacter sp. JMF_02 ED1]|uniref:pyridoxamine 5'-phosphate oxidase family protein n=1 Tax=unclassified Campylobacter TaxID=2593542 RepID=UPI0022E9BAA1|nr:MULTISPECIES: pyridoxamine 5'-phosphate oxidase family protein [unclassified Campylobacter]MDA3049326.1 pyridoxamine 5'-phosphate oxidase family protein [Campylobacter sp. JMF_15 NE4]MDA3051249.1 pyridoxamine 5'-phosphate oxidase family protein [Campylobacter sp. JMF_02 ED1]
MRRKDRELSNEEAYKIIDDCEYAIISCVRDNGEIFSIPLSIARENDSIFIHGAPEGSKAELFTQGREVSIVCVSYNQVPVLSDAEFEAIKDNTSMLGKKAFTTEYTSAIARAKAYEVGDEPTMKKAMKLLCEKYCKEYMSAFETAINGQFHRMKIYEFKIQSVSAKAKKIK